MGSNDAGAPQWPSEFVGESEDFCADYYAALAVDAFADSWADEETAGVDIYGLARGREGGSAAAHGSEGGSAASMSGWHHQELHFEEFLEPGPSTSAHTTDETQNPDGRVVKNPEKAEQEPGEQNGTAPPPRRDVFYHDDKCVRVLEEWWNSHQDHAYPSRLEKEKMSSATHLSVEQVTSWFSNARKRR